MRRVRELWLGRGENKPENGKNKRESEESNPETSKREQEFGRIKTVSDGIEAMKRLLGEGEGGREGEEGGKVGSVHADAWTLLRKLR
eukprot:3078160-Rhodomonas_salina.1